METKEEEKNLSEQPVTTDINEMNKYKQIYGFLKYYKDYILLIKTERFRDNKCI